MTQDKDQPTSEHSVDKTSESNADDKLAQDKKNNADEALAKLQQDLKEAKEAELKKPKDTPGAADNKSKNTASKPSKPASKVATDNAKSVKSSTSKPVKSGRGLAFFATLLALIALGGSGYLFWQAQMWLKTQQQVENLQQQSFENSQQTINQLQSRVTSLQSELSQSRNQQNALNQTLLDLQARTQELGETQPNQWLAAEALYLVNLAERRLLIERDINTALQLLVAANTRLTAMNDPSVFALREAISKDVAALHAIKQPSTEAIYLALSGVVDQVSKLEFKDSYTPQKVIEEATPEVSSESSDWQHNLAISFERFLNNFLRVKVRNVETGPQLPTDQQWYVRSNITYQLLQAQHAALNGQQALYLDGVSKSQNWIAMYFNNDSDLVVATSTTLDELLNKDVSLTLPTQLTSQSLISDYVRNELNLNANVGATND